MQRRGYSLFELLVVLVLLALVAVGVLVSVKEPLRRARSQMALDEWKALDNQIRALAQRSNRPVWLVVDSMRHTVERVNTDSQGHQLVQRLPMMGAWTTVLMSGTTIEMNVVRIPFWPSGQSSTYAVSIPEQRGRSQWLVLAGVTGQAVVVTHEATIDELLARARPARSITR